MADNEYAFPKDVYKQLQWSTIVAHEMIKSGYNSILGHLENPPMNDLSNFLGYCAVWADIVEKHHGVEERFLFPLLGKKLDFSHELEQHKPIHEGINKVVAFLKKAKVDHSKFDAAALRELMAAFKDVLFIHLDDEIQDLSPERLQVFTEGELKEISDGLDNEARKEGGLLDVLPFAFGHIPVEYKPYFPAGLPGFIRNFLLPYVIVPIHGGWWKYCPRKP
ncbi:hypothetical protein Clacol_005410 [Clathrus columnatus]|uniref:Hemerythrin-like domain-containing protein n=1 Tax=Clathrus columnatus TaxID=1419009 RepID=A0AAV5ACG8_9AGAM|nr:hypothetical protein Clacol_005410 [Clathrus columnatus]